MVLLQIYPIWLCSFVLPSNPGMLQPANSNNNLFVDIGTYGTPNVDNFDPVETTRRVEQFVRSVNGWVLLFTFSKYFF